MEAFELNWALVKRAVRKPPKVIFHRLAQMALARWRRRSAPKAPEAWRPSRLLMRSREASMEALWRKLLQAPWPGEGVSILLRERFPAAVQDVLAKAEQAHAGEVDLLGSGPFRFGQNPPWHTDFKTGFVWAPRYCHDIAYADLGRPNDVKVPWELSRFQWALPLAQAYALTGEGRHAERFAGLVEDWCEANPYAMSVNWSCTMDVALRAMTWIWGLWLTQDAPCWTEARKGRVLSALYGHGHFIYRNLEVSDVNGNHYLSDAAGLVYLGLFFQDLGEAPRWLAAGRRILEAELFLQTYEDGVDHEGSIPYHRLVLELLLHPFLFMERRGHGPSAPVRERVRRMASFVADYSGPDGRAPRLGDADDGRALALGDQSLEDHRYLCHLVGSWLGDEALLSAAGRPWAEALWAWGPGAWHDPWPVLAPRPSVRYPEGGLAILRNARIHLVAEAGPIGLRGRGGHGHNDATSFELWMDGERLVVDRGAWVYTADAEGRNLFRATASHNVVQAGDEEMNRFVDPMNLWQLKDEAQAELRDFQSHGEGGGATARHHGYTRLGLEVERAWKVGPEGMTLKDALGPFVDRPLTSRWWLEEGVEAEVTGATDLILISPKGRRFRVAWSDPRWRLTLMPSTLSPSYGRRLPTLCLEWVYAPEGTGAAVACEWSVQPC